MIARDGSDKRCCIIRKIKHCGMRGICCCPRGWAGHLYFSVSILEVLAVVYRFAIRYLFIHAICQRRGTQHPQTTRFRMAIMFSKTGTRKEIGMPENCWWLRAECRFCGILVGVIHGGRGKLGERES